MTDVLIMSDNAATLSFQIGEYLASRGSTSDIKAFGRGVSGAASNLLKVVRQKQTRRAPPGSATVKSSVPASISTPASAAHMSLKLAEQYAKGLTFHPSTGLPEDRAVKRALDLGGFTEESKAVSSMLERFPRKLSKWEKMKARAFATLDLKDRIKELPALKTSLKLSDRDARHLLLHEVLPLTLTDAQEEALDKFAMLDLAERVKELPALKKILNLSEGDNPPNYVSSALHYRYFPDHLLAIPRIVASDRNREIANRLAGESSATKPSMLGRLFGTAPAVPPNPSGMSVADAFGKNPFGKNPFYGGYRRTRRVRRKNVA